MPEVNRNLQPNCCWNWKYRICLPLCDSISEQLEKFEPKIKFVLPLVKRGAHLTNWFRFMQTNSIGPNCNKLVTVKPAENKIWRYLET